MAREIINVGATSNDGQGDPIRTAFIKSNDNFAELYSRAQTNVPTSLTGSPGDRTGMYAADANTFYWCFQDYDGSSVIWAETTNAQITDLINGSSNVSVASSANVTVSVDGVSNVAQFSASLATLANVLVPGTLSVAEILCWPMYFPLQISRTISVQQICVGAHSMWVVTPSFWVPRRFQPREIILFLQLLMAVNFR